MYPQRQSDILLICQPVCLFSYIAHIKVVSECLSALAHVWRQNQINAQATVRVNAIIILHWQPLASIMYLKLLITRYALLL